MFEAKAIAAPSGRSRSEAAKLGWEKRQRAAPKSPSGLSPAVQARVKEILAAQANKGKKKAKVGGKGKAKGKAGKKKDSRTPQEKTNQNRAQVAKQTGMGDLEGTLVRLNAGKQGAGMENDKHDALISKGLAQRAADGTVTLSPAGKKWKAAADKGDKDAASGALAEARAAQANKEKASADKEKATAARTQAKAERTAASAAKKQEREKKQQAKLTAAAAAKKKQKAKKGIDMDDLVIKAGARHSSADMKHIQAAHDSTVAAGAACAPSDNAPDAAAEAAIKGIMDDPGYFAQHECGDVMQACSALQTLAMLIQSELSEEDEDIQDISQLVDAARTLVTFIGSELDEMESAAEEDVKEDANEPVPMAKAADDAWLHMDGGEIKAMDDDAIKGLAVLYATKSTHDLEKDYYDKDTDLWLDHWGWPRPITYHHGMDAGTRDDPVVGHWTKATVTDEGVWLEGQLDRAHRYYKAVKELARRGYLKISSDSGPQWVIREPQSNGANYIKRWPLVSASVTVTPMEPRMFPVEVKAFLAELGYEAIENDSQEANDTTTRDRSDATKADTDRARALAIELTLLELEETAL